MSIFSNGDQPGEKEPNPKRRRTRRPGNRTGREDDTLRSAEKAPGLDVRGDQNRGSNSNGFGQKNGSRGAAKSGRAKNDRHHTKRDVLAESDQALSGSSIRVNDDLTLHVEEKHSRKRNRRRGRRNAGRMAHNDTNSELRHVRAMPKPVQDAQYAAPMEPKPASRRKPHHHGASQKHVHGRAGPQNRNHSPVYAALDLGTNNCRLLLATPFDRGKFRVVDGFSRIVRLGEGLEQSGSLSELAMDRAIGALKVCATKLEGRKIRKQRLIATEACRQALNGDLFLKRVKQETGLDLEVVDRETEARLAAEGCGSLMDKQARGAVLFDIGGGSSELVLVDRDANNIKGKRRRKIDEQIVAWTSLPMGVVTLAERFGGRDVTPEVFEEMVQDVMQHIESFEGRNALSEAFEDGNVHLLGTSGTVTTLAGIHLELPKYDRRRVDGIWLQDGDVDHVINRLIKMTYAERAANPCIGEERADLVLAGCAILNAIRLAWPTPRLRVADRGLREGLLAQMMNSDGAWSKRYRDRRLYGRRGVGKKKQNDGGEKS